MRLAVVLLTSHVLLLVHCATCHSPVRDELVRLRAGREHWETGVFRADPGNPPLVDMCAALPLFVGSACGGTGESPPRPLGANIESKWMVPSRWALIPFSVCGGVVCFCWARSLFGAAAGLFALLMWSCDPLILAHGALITGDVVATTTGIAASYVFWRWMQNPITKHAATAGAGLGVALISKYVWVIMVPIWFTLWLVQRLKKPTSRLRQDAWHSCVAGAVALYVVNLGFGFEESFQPISSFEFQNPGMGWLSSVSGYDTDTGDPGAISWLPVPLPRNYVMGIDAIASHVAIVDRATYVHGDFVESNVWYFYLFGLLVKMPLGTWLLLAVAVYARLTSPKRQFERSEPLETDATGRNARSTVDATGRNACSTEVFGARHWFTDLVLWLPAITVLVFVSWVTQNKMLRYILPMLPFVFIWIGHAFVWAQEGRWWRKTLVYGALAWSVLCSLWVYPHSLSYFNEAAGGTTNGHAHLIGASYDWGQDLLFLKDWSAEHPEARPLHVACYNAFQPLQREIETDALPRLGPKPGWYAVSASVLRGAWTRQFSNGGSATRDYEYLELFLNETPVDRVAYSIFIYHLDCEQANAMRAKLRLKLIECGEPNEAAAAEQE